MARTYNTNPEMVPNIDPHSIGKGGSPGAGRRANMNSTLSSGGQAKPPSSKQTTKAKNWTGKEF